MYSKVLWPQILFPSQRTLLGYIASAVLRNRFLLVRYPWAHLNAICARTRLFCMKGARLGIWKGHIYFLVNFCNSSLCAVLVDTRELQVLACVEVFLYCNSQVTVAVYQTKSRCGSKPLMLLLLGECIGKDRASASPNKGGSSLRENHAVTW